ncbi:MAG: hypothetical protein AAF492_22080 [Verrucomicrobiota bacterium]
MIAPNHETPEPGNQLPNASLVKIVALYSILPTYLLIAWLIDMLGGSDPIVSHLEPYLVFSFFCAAGLGCVVYSFQLRYRIFMKSLEKKPKPDETRAVSFGMGLAEIPAALGLIHFVLFRDWTGLMVLLMISFIAFIFHVMNFGMRGMSSSGLQS